MTGQEVQSYFTDVLGKLWPKWKTNDAQVLTWAKSLKYFNFSAVRRATEEHFTSQEGSYGRPKLYAIVEKARLYQPGNTQAKQSSIDYEPNVFVQCIEHKNPIKVFQHFATYVQQQYYGDRDYMMKAAESMRQKFETLYGGRWIVIQQTTADAMSKQLQEHRAGVILSR
jgi:hypothetical protein